MNTIGSRGPTGTAATMVVEFSLKLNCKVTSMMNNATVKFYGELKLAVNTLLHAAYQKTHEKIFLEFLEI